ncbi:MAG: phage tail protein, partial [Clostridia bacterium]
MVEIIITTKIGRGKFAKAHETGILPRITHLAFGNAGHDAQGNPIPVDDNRATVPGQFPTLRPISSVSANGTVCTIIGRLYYAHEGGQIVSTCGLIDSAGDLIAYKNFSTKAKDA